MAAQVPRILVVDDEPYWLEMIHLYLRDAGYDLVNACSGEEALSLLTAEPYRFDLVILDKFMSGMDGMEVLQQIKADPKLKILPVVLQTGDTAPDKVLEGIRAGAYYYLTKPFSADQLQAVVANALQQYRTSRLAGEELDHLKDTLQWIDEVRLNFRSREQARSVTALLATSAGLNMVQQMGLMELMLNAVEHGNLAISYDEKTRLIRDNRLDAEIAYRLTLPEYADRVASVTFRRVERELIFTIHDRGCGFDWRPYLDMQLERIHDNHGRGIAMAKNMAFHYLQFQGCGNIVEVRAYLPE